MKKLLPLIFLILIFAIVLVIYKFRPRPLYSPFTSTDLKTQLAQQIGVLPEETENALVASVSGYKVYFSKEKDLTTQVTALQMILRQATIGVKEIDLRFDKPILRF